MSIAYRSSGGAALASEQDLAERFIAENQLSTIAMQARQAAHRARKAGDIPATSFDRYRRAAAYKLLRTVAAQDDTLLAAWHDFKARG